jgi:hypothetical protein
MRIKLLVRINSNDLYYNDAYKFLLSNEEGQGKVNLPYLENSGTKLQLEDLLTSKRNYINLSSICKLIITR